LIKKSICKNTKQISTTPEKQSVVYTSSQIQTEIEEFKDRKIEHRGLYWFTLNQELHPVFPETTGNPLSNQP